MYKRFLILKFVLKRGKVAKYFDRDCRGINVFKKIWIIRLRAIELSRIPILRLQPKIANNILKAIFTLQNRKLLNHWQGLSFMEIEMTFLFG